MKRFWLPSFGSQNQLTWKLRATDQRKVKSLQADVEIRALQQGQTQSFLTWRRGWESHTHLQAAIHSSYVPLNCLAEVPLSLRSDRWRPNHSMDQSTWFFEGSDCFREIPPPKLFDSSGEGQGRKASRDITRKIITVEGQGVTGTETQVS